MLLAARADPNVQDQLEESPFYKVVQRVTDSVDFPVEEILAVVAVFLDAGADPDVAMECEELIEMALMWKE